VKTLFKLVKLPFVDVKLVLFEVVKLLFAVEPPLMLYICMSPAPLVPLFPSEAMPPFSLGCKKVMLLIWLRRVFEDTAQFVERSSDINTASGSRWLPLDTLP